MKRLIIRRCGEDVSDDILFTEGRSNPFGWSQRRMVHRRRVGMVDADVEIGWLESGYPELTDPDYSAEIVDER